MKDSESKRERAQAEARHSDDQPSRNSSPSAESTAVSPFNFEGKDVRVIADKDGGEPWFVAGDVARALGYVSTANAIAAHCKGVTEMVTPTRGGPQKVKVIREPDVYRLVSRSKLPSAQEFERMVFEDILPSIRKTGRYEARTDNAPSHNALVQIPFANLSAWMEGMPVAVMGVIGGINQPVIDAREQHEFLEVGKAFAAWIVERIEQYEFKLGVDFEVISEIGKNPKGGRPPKDYALTLTMAKELCMVAPQAKGSAARKYFAAVEERAHDMYVQSLEAPRQAASIDFDARMDRMEAMFNRAIGLAETVIEKFVPQVSAAPVNIVVPAALNRGFEELRQQCLKQSPGTVGRSAPGRFEQISRLRRRVEHGQSERSEDRMNHGGPSRRTDCLD